MGKHLLKLVEGVVIDLLAFVLLDVLGHAVVDGEQLIAEGGHVEELLEDGVHVTDTAEISQADKALGALTLRGRNIVPLILFLELLGEFDEAVLKEGKHEFGGPAD
jgi:hypothetical protein